MFFLERIHLPTLLIQAEDDPFLPPSALPREHIESNPHLVPAIAPNGGHVGFVEGHLPLRPSFWAERQALGFLLHRLAS